MDLKVIQAFLVLADTLHFAKTAETIHVSPSTLSRMMQRLEHETKQSLFQRDNRQVVLTEAGQRFRLFAEKVTKEWQRLTSDFDRYSLELTGKLSLYCTVTAAHNYLPQLIEPFRRQHPGLNIDLETGDVSVAFSKVKKQHSDIAFAVASEKIPEEFYFYPLDTISLKVIAPKKYVESHRLFSSHEVDWDNMPIVMAESGPGRTHTQNWLQRMSINPEIYANVSGHEAIVSMVALGCGIALVPEPVLQNSPLKDKVAQLSSPVAPNPFTLGIICLQQNRHNPQIEAFISLVHQVFSATV